MKKILGTLIVAGIITVCYAASYVPQPHHPFGERILLIINFNHPYYKNIQFFNEVYTKEFPHIVFYGELAAEGVGQCRTQSGVYAYKTLADAMEKYPDYDGYLWLNDDCGITMAHVKHFDKSKIWAPCSGFGRTSGSGLIDLRKDKEGTSWCWWNSPHGIVPAFNVYQKLSIDQRKRLHANKKPWEVPYGMAEAYYIPQCYREEAIALARLCYKHGLWIEIAFPWLIDCLEIAQNRQEIAILWGEDFSSNYNEVDFFHPIKLSNPENQEFMKRVFNEY